MNILLTGSSGFIGSHVAQRLIQGQHRVWGIDRNPPLPETDAMAGYLHVQVDLGDVDALRRVLVPLPPMDLGIHSAAKQPSRLPMELVDFIHDNVAGTANLLTVAHEQGINTWIMLSSSTVYGQQALVPVREDDATNPLYPYGLSKLQAEQSFMFFSQQHGFHVCILRLDRTFGIGQRLPGFIQYLVQTLECNEDVELFCDGKLVYDPVYIDDAVAAVELAIGHVQGSSADIFNIGGGAPIANLELAQMIKEKLKSRSRIIVNDVSKLLIGYSACMDISKAREILGYAPRPLSDNLDVMLRP
ncbi:MAG: NAD(P)-dependent oxidoreductase [Magnetococcales bacterium]|nr:NAD(P)-dependent oxidoreductase [Magnetococcales bacterium]